MVAMSPGQSIEGILGGGAEAVAREGSPLLDTVRTIGPMLATMAVVDHLTRPRVAVGMAVNDALGSNAVVVSRPGLLESAVGAALKVAAIGVVMEAMADKGPAQQAPAARSSVSLQAPKNN